MYQGPFAGTYNRRQLMCKGGEGRRGEEGVGEGRGEDERFRGLKKQNTTFSSKK